MAEALLALQLVLGILDAVKARGVTLTQQEEQQLTDARHQMEKLIQQLQGEKL